MAELREKAGQLDMEHVAAKAARADAARHLDELRQRNAAFAEKRRAMEEQERPLVEQEVRLREQRDALETKEGELRTTTRGFYESAWRGGGEQASPHRCRAT